MGLNLGDLDQYLDDTFTLTVRGVEYEVQAASAELGLWCRALAARVGGELVDGAEMVAAGERAAEEAEQIPPPPGVDKNTPFEEVILGAETVAQMVDNKVRDTELRICATTAYYRILGGDEAARRYWEAGGDPNRLSPTNRQERRAAAKAKPRKASGSRTTGTAAARTTRTRASGTGTSTPKPPAKAASRSTRSSATGR